jgi:predicted dehydrogenase
VRAINTICWFYKPDLYFDNAPWRKKKGAGPVSVNLIHDVDLMRYFCGEVIAVQAQFTGAKRGYENEDVASAILRFKSGAIGTVSVSDSIAAPWSWEFTSDENPAYPSTQQSTYFIGGSEGSISVPDLHVWKHQGELDWLNPMQSEREPAKNQDPLVNQIAHFRRVILGLERPLVSGTEGTKSLAVIDAIQRAAVTQELVQLEVRRETSTLCGGSPLTEVITSSQ